MDNLLVPAFLLLLYLSTLGALVLAAMAIVWGARGALALWRRYRYPSALTPQERALVAHTQRLRDFSNPRR